MRPSSTQLLNHLYHVESGYIGGSDEIKKDLAKWNVNADGVQFVDVSTPSRRNWDTAYSYYVSARTGLLLSYQRAASPKTDISKQFVMAGSYLMN